MDLPVIIIIADGWQHAVFHESLHNGLLPEIQGELIDRGTFFTKVLSPFPSVSLSSHTTLLTSENPEKHGIPGHRWMLPDFSSNRNYLGAGVKQLNCDISTSTETIFERCPVPTFSVQSIVTRGAQHVIRPLTIDSSKLLSETGDLVSRFPESLVVLWLPRGDIVSHTHGPHSKSLVREMINTSNGIGTLSKKLQSAGLMQRARILFSSDHGQKTVNHSFDLSRPFLKRGYKSAVNPRSTHNLDIAILTNGDAAAYVYFNARTFNQDLKYDILCDLRKELAVGLICFRYSSDVHFFLSRRGIARLTIHDAATGKYELMAESDPAYMLGSSPQKFVNLAHPPRLDSSYPDIIHQYLTSFVSHRSSDVVISASADYHFGNTPRIAWRLGYHKGSHGGATRDEMLFSAISTGSAFQTVQDNPIRSKDLLRLCFPEYFAPQACGGRT